MPFEDVLRRTPLGHVFRHVRHRILVTLVGFGADWRRVIFTLLPRLATFFHVYHTLEAGAFSDQLYGISLWKVTIHRGDIFRS